MGVQDYIYRLLRERLPFPPTQDQDRLFGQLSQFIQLPFADILIVDGYAGTGKTSAMMALKAAAEAIELPLVFLAPTGRAAKVLAGYTGAPAHTIHKKIYRMRAAQGEDEPQYGVFDLDLNKTRNGLFIVDEASLISNSPSPGFGSGRLLDDLVSYVRSAPGNKLLLLGDSAQLPPVGLQLSPALDPDYMARYGTCERVRLTQVLRQAAGSGILRNATALRQQIVEDKPGLPQWETAGFRDIERITSRELIEALSEALDRWPEDEVVVICRSNKRANLYNAGIRGRILGREEALSRGDRLMVVKNCYQFLDGAQDLDFIANGDMVRLQRLGRTQQAYGFRFANATLSFPDYKDLEIEAKLLLDTLDSEAPSLNAEQQKALWQALLPEYAHLTNKRKRYLALREDPYLNALQIKHAHAITCHKSQGGQWKAVFVDKAFPDEACDREALRWYYTAFTRAVEKLYLVNF